MKQYSAKCLGCGRYATFNSDNADDAKAKWDLFKPCGCQADIEVKPDEKWEEELMDDIGDTNI